MSDNNPDTGSVPSQEPLPAGWLSVSTGRLPLPVDVLDSRMRRQGRTSGGKRLALPAGQYLVIAHFPSGDTAARPVLVNSGQETALDLTEEQAEVVKGATQRPSPAPPSGRAYSFPGAPAGEVVGPRESAAATPRAEGAPWEVRFLSAGIVGPPAAVQPPGFAVEGLRGSTLVLRFTASAPAVCLAQFRVAEVPPPAGAPDAGGILLALPVATPGASCRVFLSSDADGPTVRVHLEDELAEAAASFLHTHRAQEAHDLVQADLTRTLEKQELAQELAPSIFDRFEQDPVGAILAAHVLLLLNGRPRRRSRDPSAWLDDLVRSFPWLPDASVLQAEILARDGRREDAVGSMLEAVERGLPILTDSLTALVDRLGAYVESRWISRLTSERRKRARKAFTSLRDIGAAVDFSSVFLTLLGDTCVSELSSASQWQPVLPVE